MQIPDDLRCLFNTEVQNQGGSYVIEIPKQEIDVGTISPKQVYRVALLSSVKEPETETEREPQEPPVVEGETREVEIEDIGEQGDGIARVERGYVVIVPDTKEGERVTVDITDVQQNVAFAEVVDRQTHF